MKKKILAVIIIIVAGFTNAFCDVITPASSSASSTAIGTFSHTLAWDNYPTGNTSNGWKPSTTGSSEYLQFDLGASNTKFLTSVVVNFNNGPYSFKVQGSNTIDQNFVDIGTGSGSLCGSSNTTVTITNTIVYRYIRITGFVMSYSSGPCPNPVYIVHVIINGASVCAMGDVNCTQQINTLNNLKIQTSTSYVEIEQPNGNAQANFNTNRAKFSFNKPVQITGDIQATSITSGSLSTGNGDLTLKTQGTTQLTIFSNGKSKFNDDVYIPDQKSLVCGIDMNTGLRLGYDSRFTLSFIDFITGNLYFRNGNTCPLILQDNGSVAIDFPVNYSAPNYDHTQGYKLAVNGGILCTEVKVVSSITSDYVFEKNYNLRTLKEVEEFVNKNKHLPEIPSAAELKETGYKVGEMDDLLLRKIEELTLYVIEQNKRIEALEAENKVLISNQSK